MKLFCGLGTGELIKSWFPELEVTEAGWYQQIEDDRLKITFLPAQHWSKRSVRDGGRRLWGAFMVQGDGISIYYSGDTGYSRHFREIPELFGTPIMLWWVSVLISRVGLCSPITFHLTMH